MNTTSNLDMARKYEWNAAIAKGQNNTKEADRYEAMAKMAMIDAANCAYNNTLREHNYYSYDHTYEEGDIKLCAIGVGIAVFIMIVMEIIF